MKLRVPSPISVMMSCKKGRVDSPRIANHFQKLESSIAFLDLFFFNGLDVGDFVEDPGILLLDFLFLDSIEIISRTVLFACRKRCCGQHETACNQKLSCFHSYKI